MLPRDLAHRGASVRRSVRGRLGRRLDRRAGRQGAEAEACRRLRPVLDLYCRRRVPCAVLRLLPLRLQPSGRGGGKTGVRRGETRRMGTVRTAVRPDRQAHPRPGARGGGRRDWPRREIGGGGQSMGDLRAYDQNRGREPTGLLAPAVRAGRQEPVRAHPCAGIRTMWSSRSGFASDGYRLGWWHSACSCWGSARWPRSIMAPSPRGGAGWLRVRGRSRGRGSPSRPSRPRGGDAGASSGAGPGSSGGRSVRRPAENGVCTGYGLARNPPAGSPMKHQAGIRPTT